MGSARARRYSSHEECRRPITVIIGGQNVSNAERADGCKLARYRGDAGAHVAACLAVQSSSRQRVELPGPPAYLSAARRRNFRFIVLISAT